MGWRQDGRHLGGAARFDRGQERAPGPPICSSVHRGHPSFLCEPSPPILSHALRGEVCPVRVRGGIYPIIRRRFDLGLQCSHPGNPSGAAREVLSAVQPSEQRGRNLGRDKVQVTCALIGPLLKPLSQSFHLGADKWSSLLNVVLGLLEAARRSPRGIPGHRPSPQRHVNISPGPPTTWESNLVRPWPCKRLLQGTQCCWARGHPAHGSRGQVSSKDQQGVIFRLLQLPPSPNPGDPKDGVLTPPM